MSIKGINKQENGYQNLERNTTVTAVPQTNTNANTKESISKAVAVELGNKSQEQSKNKEQDLATLDKSINELNNKLKLTKTGFEYTYHEEINRVSIKLIDKETEEIIKEIPPEDAYKAFEKMMELTGMLIDEKL